MSSTDEISEKSVKAGLLLADVVMRRVRPGGQIGELPPPTLAELATLLSHLKASQDEWRVTAAYLAAQLHAEQTASAPARAHDMSHVINQIRGQLDWLDTIDQRRRDVQDGARALDEAQRHHEELALTRASLATAES